MALAVELTPEVDMLVVKAEPGEVVAEGMR